MFNETSAFKLYVNFIEEEVSRFLPTNMRAILDELASVKKPESHPGDWQKHILFVAIHVQRHVTKINETLINKESCILFGVCGTKKLKRSLGVGNSILQTLSRFDNLSSAIAEYEQRRFLEEKNNFEKETITELFKPLVNHAAGNKVIDDIDTIYHFLYKKFVAIGTEFAMDRPEMIKEFRISYGRDVDPSALENALKKLIGDGKINNVRQGYYSITMEGLENSRVKK